MQIIGCDLHTRTQQIAMLETTTGEITERRLQHETGEAKAFCIALPSPARVGMEATGHAPWFERMLTEQGHELWVGNPALIRAGVVRKQKTDSRDASHILSLLIEEGFPRIGIPSPAERDVWQLLRHRHKRVGFRTSVKNPSPALAMGQGVCRRTTLWTRAGRQERERLALSPWARRRRQELLEMLDRLNPVIEELDQAVEKEAESRAEAVLLMRQEGVGPVTAPGVCAHGRTGHALPEQQASGALSGAESP